MLKVVDDKHIMLIGEYNRNPFFEINEKTHKQSVRKYCLSDSLFHSQYNIHINEEEQNSYDNIDNKKLKSLLIDEQKVKMNLLDYFNTMTIKSKRDKPKFLLIYRKDNYWNKQFVDGDCSTIDKSFPSVIDYDNVDDFEVIKDMYNYLNINYPEDDFDVINVVNKLKNFDWNTLENKIQIAGIDYISNKYFDSEENDNINKKLQVGNNENITPKIISGCDYIDVNDGFNIITYTDDANSFYITNSHCWTEGKEMYGSNEHWKYGNEETNGEQIPFKNLTNSFKFTFVPYDLSEKSIWIDEYIK